MRQTKGPAQKRNEMDFAQKTFPRSIRKPAKRLRIEEEEQGNGEQLLRQTEGLAQKRNEMEFAPTTRGCTGFDGGMEAGQAGGCA